MTSEEILQALQRILERWTRKEVETEEARREIDMIVFGTIFPAVKNKSTG